MNSYKRAMKYLKEASCYQREEYKKVDELIEPLCNFLNKNGYITLHSCSAHIEEEEEKKGIQWYIVFIATKSIFNVKKVVKQINKKYKYKVIVYDDRKVGKNICGLTRRWCIQYMIWDLQTREQLIEINENIYNEFKEKLKNY